MANGNQASMQRDLDISNNLSNEDLSRQLIQEDPRAHIRTTPAHNGGPTVDFRRQNSIASHRVKPNHSRQPSASQRCGAKPARPPYFNSRKNRSTVPLQPYNKRRRDQPVEPPRSPTPQEDCINLLPPGAPFPKKPDGCMIIPQTIEHRPGDRSTIYFTRSGVLGMPLRYMYNLDDMDDGDQVVNLGSDPVNSGHITLVIAWPGYKEVNYDIPVYIPLFTTDPFVTVYGFRQLTKRELATEILRCIHWWMIEHPWSGERHQSIPEWKLSGERPGVSAKLLWLAMISPVGDGRWVTQLQTAPHPRPVAGQRGTRRFP